MSPALDVTAVAVLFDMDGTLVDSTAVVEGVWAEFADHHGLDLAEVLRFSHGRLTSDSVRHFLPDAPNCLAITAELDAQELVQLDGVVEIPGAAALLRALAGSPVAVVTSASRELARVRMRAAGLDAPDVIVTAEDVTTGKPSPEGYQRAASLLGVRAEDCVILEDAEAGLRAAVESGGQVVVVGGHASSTTRDLPRVPDYTRMATSVVGGRIHLAHP